MTGGAKNDESLLSGAEAFAEFYARNSERLLVYLTRRVYEPEVALDLTAESFACAYEGRPRLRARSQEEATAWLFGIARNLLSHYLRCGAVEKRALARLGLEVPVLSRDDLERLEELADLEELRTATRNGMEQLSKAEREAVRLRIVDELPYRQVAAVLGTTEVAARARVSRGLRSLEALLAEEGRQ